MDEFRLAIMTMAITNTRQGEHDAEGCRVYTVEELDDLADFRWPWVGVKGRLTAGANAVLSRVGPRASNPAEPMRVPSAEAVVQG